jgi:cytokinesis protein
VIYNQRVSGFRSECAWSLNPLDRQGIWHEALSQSGLLNDMMQSLTSPYIPTRRLLLDILVGYVHAEPELLRRAIELVIQGLTFLSTQNGETESPYATWFKSMEASLVGRGKMGSLVGASEDVRKNAGPDSGLNEYAVRTFVFGRFNWL